MQRQFFPGYVLLVLWIMLSSCQPIQPEPLSNLVDPQGQELAFETIELRQPVTNEKTWTDHSPGILVVASTNDVEPARQYVSDEAVAVLEKFDFSKYLVVIAFDGWKSEGRSGFQVQKIIQQDRRVLLFAQPSQKPGDVTTGVVTSLYHVIKIPKYTTWRQTITFQLYFDHSQEPVVTVTHFVP